MKKKVGLILLILGVSLAAFASSPKALFKVNTQQNFSCFKSKKVEPVAYTFILTCQVVVLHSPKTLTTANYFQLLLAFEDTFCAPDVIDEDMD